MLRALLYLKATSARNWVLSRIRRMREPKYLLGALVGFGYFYFFFFRGLARPAPPAMHLETEPVAAPLPSAGMLPADMLDVTTAVGAIALLMILALTWIIPRRPASLGFSEAEIAFLFPAPITRRGLLHFRLLSAQFPSLLGAAVMMLFSNRWSFLGGNPLTHAIGWWFIFSTMNLHFSGASFTLTRLAERGFGTWRRRALVLTGLALLIALTAGQLPAAPAVVADEDALALRPLADWLVALAAIPPLGWALWPLKQVLGPFLADDASAFLAALVPALAVITVHYAWVLRAAVAFEDATIDHAQKRAARIAAWRAGDRPLGNKPARARMGPFRLASIGRPEVAFLWKNLLSTWPYFTVRVFSVCALAIVALCTWLDAQPNWSGVLPVIGAIMFVFAAYVLVVGPQFARQDIRADLPNTDMLKIYPLAGWQIILGQLLAPAAILTGILWLALLTVALAFDPARAGLVWFTSTLRIATVVALAAIVPMMVMLQLLVPNAAALLFPAWFQASRGRGGGPEVVGQRMIFFFAQLLAMVVALLPALVAAALLVVMLQWVVGLPGALGIAAGAVLVVLAGEVWLGVWWLGGRFEKLDLSSDLRP
jgi:ABC-2 type transport system permease protein